MRKIILSIGVLGTLLVAALCAAPAYALSARTWVSNTGSGATCTETAPCATLAAALAVTASGGEIDCLTPGDYGTGTTLAIGISVTINCGDFVGGITAPSGSAAITVNGSGIQVTLKSLFINGNGVGTDGVDILNASSVGLNNVTIVAFAGRGVLDESTGVSDLILLNCNVYQNGGVGVVMAGASGSGVYFQYTNSAQNTYGLAIASGNGGTVLNSGLNANSVAGVETDPGASVLVDSSTVVGNGTGLQALGYIGINNSNVSGNSTGISGTAYSYGNNRIGGNTSAGTTPTRISLD